MNVKNARQLYKVNADAVTLVCPADAPRNFTLVLLASIGTQRFNDDKTGQLGVIDALEHA